MKKVKHGRCAITGRFITLKEALTRPDTTVIEIYIISLLIRRKRIEPRA
ncbi:MAG: hypothetical protein KZQ94_10360 [Candidatus Thiodiazotropha sp. (ex Troendleina suluensis)]|nr:hypothetical protein [Candidatus Thiodiazotropha sp. (ex Troendleina suluensis)]